jgi:hypothetical protein
VHLKQTVARLRQYLLGHSEFYVSARDVETLELADWSKALREEEHSRQRRERAIRRLVYSRHDIEATVPDRSSNPFDLLYEHELISEVEKSLVPEEWPYWDAFLAGERPRHVATRLGIDRKLASKRMKKLELKLNSMLFKQSRST